MSKEDIISTLYLKVSTTEKTRFKAARRFDDLAKLSTYTVVFVAIGLILITLLDAYGLGVYISSKYVVFVQAFASILVLVLSLIIDKEDYSMKADKMYSCASELTGLRQKILPHKGAVNVKKYNELSKEYHRILTQYETHANNELTYDYMLAKLQMPNDYILDEGERKSMTRKCIWGYISCRIFYYLPSLLFTYIIIWFWFGIGPPLMNGVTEPDATTEQSQYYLILKDKVNLRQTPDIDKTLEPKIEIRSGSIVEVVDSTHNWHRVRYINNSRKMIYDGWVRKDMFGNRIPLHNKTNSADAKNSAADL